MTVLDACVEAAKLLRPAQPTPTKVFGSADTFAKELAALSNEAARVIAKAHDWQTLQALHTINGDTVSVGHDLPTDYDRMLKKGAVFSVTHQLPLERVNDRDEWLDRELRSFVGSVGYWTLLSGQMQIKPIMPAAESVKFYYVSKHLAKNEASTTKESFTADNDTFRLPERLLTLELIWRWRHRKGLDYAEDMRNSEIAKSEEISTDKGARVIHVGRARIPSDTVIAYPVAVDAS